MGNPQTYTFIMTYLTSKEPPMLNLDAWLEAPYERAAAEDALHEDFQESRAFEVAFSAWYPDWIEVEPDPDLAEIDFIEAPAYADAFDAWLRAGSPK